MIACALRLNLCAILLLVVGCGKRNQPIPLQPRPVTVIQLKEIDPQQTDRLTGSVASWKTEELGFEVSGRVKFVIEPETNVEGRLAAAGLQGTVLASLDDHRYQLSVNSANAEINSTTQKKKAARIEAEDVIPAKQRAADADLTFTESELARLTPLLKKGAITKTAYDKAVAERDAAKATVTQYVATQEVKRAEILSLAAQIELLQESLAEAKRDVEDCKLRSSFRGQVAEVHVIPGAFVDRGQKVLTVQMMDPIKVEFEVSAATTRRLNYRDRIPVYVSRPQREPEQLNAFVYIIDPTADPETRTFTVTLLMANRQIKTETPSELKGKPIARTRDLWKLIDKFDDSGKYFVEEHAIVEDPEGSAYMWKVTNRNAISESSNRDPRLIVEKVNVKLGPGRLPFLGLWTFREVALVEGEKFDRATDFITGQLIVPQGLEISDGDTVLFEQERWFLRPGDLIQIDVSGEKIEPGFYVPMDAIVEESNRYYVYQVDSDSTARKTEVAVLESYDTLRRIEATGSEPLEAGARIVAAGAHYITAGEKVSVVEQVEVLP